MKKLALIAALVGIAVAAQAEEVGYAGFGLGYATQKLDTHPDGSHWKQSKGKFGAKVYAGYQFNENFALEGGYNYLNKDKTSDLTDDGKLHLDVQGHVFSFAAKGNIPLNNEFSLFGKAGVGAFYSKTKLRQGSRSETKNKTHAVPALGAGVEYKVSKELAIRAEYEYFGHPKLGFDGAKLKRADMFSIGINSAF